VQRLKRFFFWVWHDVAPWAAWVGMVTIAIALVFDVASKSADHVPAEGTPKLRVVTYPEAWGELVGVTCDTTACVAVALRDRKYPRAFPFTGGVPTRVVRADTSAVRRVMVVDFVHDGKGGTRLILEDGRTVENVR
jgi:hypothetical protein